MAVEELIEELKKLANDDPEENHLEADELLLKFINNEEVAKAFNDIKKWYS